MEEGKKVSKGLIGYKVFIDKWNDEAAKEVLAGLIRDLVGYTEEEAESLLSAELPVQIVENATYTAAVYLGTAFENMGCTADVFYKDEHIIFEGEIPEVFDETGALTEEALKVFEKISNRNRVKIDESEAAGEAQESVVGEIQESAAGAGNGNTIGAAEGSTVTTFGNYEIVIDDIIKKAVERPVQHRVLEDKPIGYMPAVPLGKPKGRFTGRPGGRPGGRRHGGPTSVR
ncbi:MAG: hypothetical protein IJJ74_09035 [Eubacterium sp.]|nr:hypothetical protein [Eubacterium sp.]